MIFRSVQMNYWFLLRLGNLRLVFSIFFSSLAARRSSFLISSAGGSCSGFIPRLPNISRTLVLF